MIRTLLFLALSVGMCAAQNDPAPDPRIPESLQIWKGWALWGEEPHSNPPIYSDPAKRPAFWPSRLELTAGNNAAEFEISAKMFSEGWFPLPGDKDVWPHKVLVGGIAVPVLERSGTPSIRLEAGNHRVTGSYEWESIPQRLRLPKEYGIVRLVLSGVPVDRPSWDPGGFLWLQRGASNEQADRDFLSVHVYSLLEDGIPMWLRTEVELIVSGKSREVDLGGVIPEGWQLAAVESGIPVIIDAQGRMKAQVRAGRWVVQVSSFNLENPDSLAYPSDVKKAVDEELIGFRSKPDFRMVEITGAPSVDVSQTTYPEKWRSFPVFLWKTGESLGIEERVRGMGVQRPEGLGIQREWWLDETGHTLTFRDRITGTMQEIWRLDAASGQELGSVQSGGEGQLITRNPSTGAPGVEIRTRAIDLEATGRMSGAASLPATGWEADADRLNVTLNLPPGWRLVALFGADYVNGDWVTQWTLLDLFLLLIFTLAVFRLWGVGPAALAFVSFALTYHEPGAPKFLWLLLLIPLGLLRVVPNGWAHRLVSVWKWATVLALTFILVPFVANQVQQALYPQLEPHDSQPIPSTMPVARAESMAPSQEPTADIVSEGLSTSAESRIRSFTGGRGKGYAAGTGVRDKQNLLFEAGARIQTGPGIPDWTWRSVTFGWNGPVTASQQVRPILLPMFAERILSVLRIALVIGLAFVLLKGTRIPQGLFGTTARAAALAAALLLAAQPAHAQFPEPQLLETLKNRLLESSDAFPNAAEIPSVHLRLDGLRLSMEAEIHTAAQLAVPLPGNLPAWTPLSVSVNGEPAAALRREDGSLWIVLEAGVHQVTVEGLLADVTEWEWTFQLMPRSVHIEAPEWTVSGVRPNGIPERQVFFTRKEATSSGQSTYERQDLEVIATVERTIELGLVWRVQTTVRRLSPPGKALSLKIPLIQGENILTPGTIVSQGAIEVRLGAGQSSFSWHSEITPRESIELTAGKANPWAERWSLIVSPVWNISMTGLAPVFQSGNPELVPFWTPWPGESVSLKISRPEAIPGATVTIRNATHRVALGIRQRTASLDLALTSSLGEDFLIHLPEESEITALTLNNQAIPVRRDRSALIIPLSPGEQSVAVAWKTNVPLGFEASTDSVRLPMESANITTIMTVPASRWVLWTEGPLRGPAVRFWTVLVCSLLGAFVLGRFNLSPLKTSEWVLLSLGLTQVPLPAALVVVGWLFFLSWRGLPSFLKLSPIPFNLLQVCLVAVTALALLVFVSIVAAGLLGSPKMFITGNGSTPEVLRWYQPSSDGTLPNPSCWTVSIWWYRFLMLLWALWLAASLIRWLRWGWQQFSTGDLFRNRPSQPPPVPPNPPGAKATTPPDLP